MNCRSRGSSQGGGVVNTRITSTRPRPGVRGGLLCAALSSTKDAHKPERRAAHTPPLGKNLYLYHLRVCVCSLLRQHVLTGSAPARRGLHTSSRQADSSRAWLTRVHRQAYARLYPVLLVKQDGSTVHIRYREPRRVLEMPVDLDTLSPEERRTRLRKRETQLQKKKEEKPELSDDFDEERYKRFWTKK
ncbi:39S ribosomal protein L55, mitochondrial [Leptonychotes weddellii]|uniref:39S ribosomal protein L55, mitochondrial n=2 Tax=Monachinae TaxID=3410119 RepID=A0A7F8RQX1_LEPWE|nr:39S ribosomal protein L55, mitochondrial [Leptonychotes weddellii]